MAAETFRIEIPINVDDKTDPGVSNATKKMSKFDKQNEKTKKRLDEMNKTKFKLVLDAVDKASRIVDLLKDKVGGIAGRAWRFTMSVVDKVTAPIKSMISFMGKLLGVSGAVSAVLSGLTIKNALAESNEMARMTTQLKVSAKNMGINDAGVETILQKADTYDLYSNNAMTGVAAELATYFEDVDSITRMMDTVADYAAGMSGGVELSTTEMIDYATNLAKMTTGAYDAMTKKGFEVTDAQKKILDSGTDMQKVAVIEKIIQENWEGMADAMAELPTGQVIKLKNAWADISENIGEKATPAYTKFIKMLNTKMPAISKLLTGVAEKGASMFEEIIPTIEAWIDTAIEKIEKLQEKLSGIFNSDEFKNADLFGKIKILWNEIIVNPFSEWWSSTGKAWFIEKAGSIGEAIGSGITTGLLALLGLDSSGALEDGKSIGSSFIEGFKETFDTEKITEALKEWASDNKGIIAGIGVIVGGKIIGGIAKLFSESQDLYNGLKNIFSKGGSDPPNGSNTGTSSIFSTQTMNVAASVVNVYGASINNASGTPNIPTGTPPISLPSGKTPLSLPGVGEAGASAGAFSSATSWFGKLLQVGSKGSVVGADGTLVAVQGGVGGALGSVGSALGSGATTAAGTAVAGAAGGTGILAGAAGLVSSGIDVYQGVKKSEAGDSKGAKDEYWAAGSKAGMVGVGAGIGAAIGSVVPVVGTGIGAAVGAGIGGITALATGNKAGKALSDSTDEGGWLNETGKSISKFFKTTLPEKWNSFWGDVGDFFANTIPTWVSGLGQKITKFFTETIPEKWNEFWEGVGKFFTETIPYALGYVVGKIVTFFTEDVPQFFTDLWDGITTFFGTTLPTWISDVWNNKIVPFFTEDIPQFFADLWDGIKTFFTTTLPTWISNTWNNKIVPFFTEDVPQFFSDLWNGLVTFFTVTIPTWSANIWNNKIVPFFTESIPQFFSDLWSKIKEIVTKVIPEWASSIAGKITGWFSSISDWFSELWEKIKSNFSLGYSDGSGKKGESEPEPHAWGGIMTKPHMGIVAEAGPESIIPLSPSKRQRGIDLWEQTGRHLGVTPYEDGGIAGNIQSITMPVNMTDENGHNAPVLVTVSLNPEFVINGDGTDNDSIVALIRANLKGMADELGGEMAEQLAKIFANMPVKGRKF